MANYNKSILIGRLTEDPRLAPETFGKNAATITIAVNDFYRDSEGRPVKTSDFFKIRLYGQPAAFAAMNLGKNSLVMVSGRLKTEKWDDKESGAKRSQVVLVVDRSEDLQGLSPGGHPAGDDELGSEGAPESARPIPGSRPEQSLPRMNAGSSEFEAQHGIQKIPF